MSDEARRRTERGKHSMNQRVLVAGHDQIGYAGEELFSVRTGLPMPPRYEYGGDPGYDFVAPNGLTVDVKTVSLPRTYDYHLLVEEHKVVADVYVLAWCDAALLHTLLARGERGYHACELVAWATQLEMWRAPVRVWHPRGVPSHGIPRSELGELRHVWRYLGFNPPAA